MVRAGFAALALACVVMGAGAAQAQSRTPSQEQDAMAEGLMSRMQAYCLGGATPAQSMAAARAEGFVSPPVAVSSMMAQSGVGDAQVLWKMADAEIWVLMTGSMTMPQGAAEMCMVAGHPSVDDFNAGLEAALGVGPAQPVGSGMNGFIFEQRPDGTRQGLAAARGHEADARAKGLDPAHGDDLGGADRAGGQADRRGGGALALRRRP